MRKSTYVDFGRPESLGDFHDPIVSMQKICVTFTFGDEFNRMQHDVEMI